MPPGGSPQRLPEGYRPPLPPDKTKSSRARSPPPPVSVSLKSRTKGGKRVCYGAVGSVSLERIKLNQIPGVSFVTTMPGIPQPRLLVMVAVNRLVEYTS